MAKSDDSNDDMRDSDHDIPSSAKNGGQAGPDQTAAESREQKLKRIQADVAAGKYDSDEVLDRALEIMLKQLSDAPE